MAGDALRDPARPEHRTIPDGDGNFEIEFDFRAHELRITQAGGGERAVKLEPKTVAQFHAETFAALAELGIDVEIWPVPVEVEVRSRSPRTPCTIPTTPAAAELFWRQLVQADRVLTTFRSGFAGKASPVHFFWGSFDMAVTRFSGRRAPAHPGGAPNCADWVMVEGYSHELSSCGFWPGGGEEGAFYAYAYPEPDGFSSRPVSPPRPPTTRTPASSCCRTRWCAAPPDPDATAAGVPADAPTRRPPTPAAGTARRSTTRRCGRPDGAPFEVRVGVAATQRPR